MSTDLFQLCLGPTVTPLAAALATGQYNVNSVEEEGLTPFLFVVKFVYDLMGRQEHALHVLSVLRAFGASLERRFGNGDTALCFAARRDYLPLVQLLLELGAEVDVENTGRLHDTPLMQATNHGSVEMVRMLLLYRCKDEQEQEQVSQQEQVQQEQVQQERLSPIMIACARGHREIARMLLSDDPACIRHTDRRHTNLLMLSVLGKNPALFIDLLCQLNLDAEDDDGNHVLHFAAGHDEPEMVDAVLCSNPSLLDRRNHLGETPMMVTTSLRVAQLLHARGGDVTLVDYRGFSVLVHATASHRPHLVRWLLSFDEIDDDQMLFAELATSSETMRQLVNGERLWRRRREYIRWQEHHDVVESHTNPVLRYLCDGFVLRDVCSYL